ncbi:Uncharacterised protein [Klebsiella pneumoniae]|nr:Uncharacterised protein [Klebsiella pneumoniae]HBY9743091.1 hypothetical protein [Klebsiella pneumoniae]HBY9792770.1 hypothetical protein [Klebsiella pneumoniae]
MSKPSETLRLTVHYGYYLEVMTSTLNQRLDRFLCFCQFLLGASVFADSTFGWLIGFLIAAISAAQLAYKPGAAAGHAKLQAQRYKILCDELNTLDSAAAQAKLHDIEENDSPINTLLCNPARLRACIALGFQKDAVLTGKERLVACLGGGIPE